MYLRLSNCKSLFHSLEADGRVAPPYWTAIVLLFLPIAVCLFVCLFFFGGGGALEQSYDVATVRKLFLVRLATRHEQKSQTLVISPYHSKSQTFFRVS